MFAEKLESVSARFCWCSESARLSEWQVSEIAHLLLIIAVEVYF